MCKVVCDCHGFALLCTVTGLEILRVPLSQSLCIGFGTNFLTNQKQKNATNSDLDTRVFPLYRTGTRVYTEFSLAPSQPLL